MNYKDILWISHSAISAFTKCPHLYYMEYIYRNPKTGNRIQIVNPYLSLGSAVHETIEELADVPIKKRLKMNLKERFEEVFTSYSGLRGGFVTKTKEENFKKRGLEMVSKVEGSEMLKSPSIKTKTNFPTVDLFKNIKLVGSLDWIEKLPKGGAHIIDFKTGNSRESNGSLQLPIYLILGEENINENVEKTSYWYLQHDNSPVEHKVGELSSYMEKIKEISLSIKQAIDNNNFPCNYPGRCFACGDYSRIFEGEAKMVGTDKKRKKDNFCIFKKTDIMEKIEENNFLDDREKKVLELRMNNSLEIVGKELNLSLEKLEKIGEGVKQKLKDNLSLPELKVIIRELKSNG